MSLKYVQTNTLYLSGAGTIVGATSITLTALTDIYGNVLTMTDFGAKGYITLEPDTANEEAATFTGITANTNGTYTLTGVETALARSPYTETNGLVRQHSGGTKVVVTDNVAFWNTFANKNNDEVIQGNWTFVNAPTSLSATPASTTQLGNVKLSVAPSKALGTATITIASPAVITVAAHGLIAGDSVQFTTTGALPTGITTNTTFFVIAAGLTTNTFEIATGAGGTAINTSGSQSGVHSAFKVTPVSITDNDPRVFPNAYAVDSGTANTYVLTLATAPAALVAGQVYDFLAANANTSASTLNINGLGAKSILRPDGSALQSSDIGAGQTLMVIYDGTNFRLNGLPPAIKFGGNGSDGALNVTSGTTTIALGGAALVVKNYTSINVSNGATLTFSGGHANGTIVVLKSQGAVTIAGTINGSALGALGGASVSGFSSGATGNSGNSGNSFSIAFAGPNPGGGGPPNGTSGAGGALKTVALQTSYFGNLLSALQLKYEHLWSSAGGGSGGAFFNSSGGSFTSGVGGNAGLTLLIECGGALNAQGTINLSGGVGGLASVAGGQQSAGGGGGGAGGFFMCLYNVLTANTLTLNLAGGTGGNSVFTSNVSAAGGGGGGSSLPTAGNNGSNVTSGQGGGNGAAGTSIVLQNTEYV